MCIIAELEILFKWLISCRSSSIICCALLVDRNKYLEWKNLKFLEKIKQYYWEHLFISRDSGYIYYIIILGPGNSHQFATPKINNAWILSKYGVFSSPYFPAYGDLLRKSPYSVRMRENTYQKKLRISTLFAQWVEALLNPKWVTLITRLRLNLSHQRDHE